MGSLDTSTETHGSAQPLSGSGWALCKMQGAATYGLVTGGLQWAWGPSYLSGLLWGSVGVCKSRWVCA